MPPDAPADSVGFSFFSSFGCPLACTFCCSPEVSGLRWKAQPADEMLAEVIELKERFRFDTLHYFDANYGVMERRVRSMAEGLVDAGVHLWQQAYMQAPSVARFADETLQAMAESGFHMVLIGGETGAEDTMKLVRKTTKVGENLTAVRRLADVGISPQVTYIIGLPGEDERSMQATLEEARRVLLEYPRASPEVWPYRAIPGTPTYREALEEGYRPPGNLVEWGEFGDYRIDPEWPSNVPQSVVRRRLLFHHFAGLSKGVTRGRTGRWEQRARRRLERGDWRFARLEAKAFDWWWRVERALG